MLLPYIVGPSSFRLWMIPPSYENDPHGLDLFCEIHYCRMCCFLSSGLVSGILASGFVESWPCRAVEETQKVAVGHVLCSLELHTHRIHRRVFDSTVKLTASGDSLR